MKLNQKEQIILKQIQDGASIHYMPYAGRMNPNAYYFIGGTGCNEKCTNQIKKFIKLGLITEEKRGFSKSKFTLSEEGKNFQCELEKTIRCVEC